MSSIDEFLPAYQFSERHSRRVASDPLTILDAVASYRPDADPLFKVMIGLREFPMRLLRRSADAPRPFGLHNFTLLGRTEEATVYGLIGQFWKMDYGLHPLADGDAFKAFRQQGIAKLVLGFAVQRQPDGLTLLATETRVYCPDRASRLKFTPYWLLIRPVSGLIRRRILSSIKQASEQQGALKP
jgi:hypothetical protein